MGAAVSGPDPLRYARFLQCCDCGRVAFPVDAVWLEDELLILATYPASCEHSRDVMLVMDVRRVIVETSDIAPELYLPGRRCMGTNRRRKRCGAYAAPGSEFCPAHNQIGARQDGTR